LLLALLEMLISGMAILDLKHEQRIFAKTLEKLIVLGILEKFDLRKFYEVVLKNSCMPLKHLERVVDANIAEAK
jgi:hypothetical protein